MAKYVDGFVIPVPKKNLAAYKRLAKVACKVWMEHGALEYRECVGEELVSKFGVSFAKLSKAKAGETVVFAWIVYKSKADRNRINAKVMADPRIAKAMSPKVKMPFDPKRMAHGGFEVLVEA
ncbi:MAG: DUF1428 domain-containing protein [Phycisphaerales bacterium]